MSKEDSLIISTSCLTSSAILPKLLELVVLHDV